MTVRTLGKYVLRERLGRGGMAEVYKAYQPGLERFVAVKILHPHLAEAPDFLTRFHREAQAVAQLRHPNIVQVFDFDVADEQPYMVMEYIEGRPLKVDLDDRFTRGEQIPARDVLRLFDALLDAVGYAHARGMVHRDLKPANVMLENTGRVVLTDFGIARMVNAEKLTQTGVTLGSPAYMSLEQGQGDPADARSDIYALGIMLFECLAGQVPFEGDTSVSILLKHATAPIPSLHALRPDLPGAFDEVLHTALAKKPADRYQTADEMRAALRGFTDTEPRLATPRTRPARLARLGLRPVRWPALAVIGLSALVLAVAGLVFGSGWLTSARAGQAVQTGQARLASGDYQLAADAFTAALALDPHNTAALQGRAQASEQLFQIDSALVDLEQVITLEPANGLAYAERARLAVQYQDVEDPAARLADFDQAVQLAPDSARVHFLRGWAILNFPLVDGAPNPAAALGDLRRAVELDPQGAEAQFTLARALLASGAVPEALEPANRAVELAPEVARYWMVRGHIRAMQGDFVAAADDLTAALRVETEPTAQATLYAERAYLHRRLNATDSAMADAAQAARLDPGSSLAQLMQSLLDSASPHPTGSDLERARALAPADDPIWQAVLNEIETR